MDDLISRQAAVEVVKRAWAKGLEPTQYIEQLPSVESGTMKLIDGEHLKGWILARWIEIDPKLEYPLNTMDILDQIDREYAYPAYVTRGVIRVRRKGDK